MKLFITILSVSLFLFCGLSKGQNFSPSPLVTIPGNNTEFDVYAETNGVLSPAANSFLVWVNKDSSVYTIYVKQISSLGDNLIAASDSNLKSNPHIFLNKIVWQTFENNKWEIFIRRYNNGRLSDTVTCIDSTINDPQVNLNQDYAAWIKDGSLFEENITKPGEAPVQIDSINCSSPILSDYNSFGNSILYIKNIKGLDNLCYASYNYWQNPAWSIKILDTDSIIANPELDSGGGIAFQYFYDSVWRIKYSFNFITFITSTNKSCNYENPFFFSYPILTKSSITGNTPFFVVYDSDSLSNKEIYVQPVMYPFDWDSLTNVSKSEGDDYNPKVTFIYSNDTNYIAILWNHTQNNKTDIWMAKDIYNPEIGDVKKVNESAKEFKLLQNYPNPFNPSTTIEYQIPNSSFVTLKIYDGLGRLVKTLVNQYENKGTYNVKLSAIGGSDPGRNARILSSGIYFYQLRVVNHILTKKMILMK